jgi:hypothetical protein
MWLRLIALAVAVGVAGVVPDTAVEIRTVQDREQQLEIPVGIQVAWSNQEEIKHTVTSGVPDSADGTFAGVH